MKQRVISWQCLVFACLGLFLMGTGGAMAQTVYGVLAGTVTDATGAVVAGAKIQAIQTQSGEKFQAVSTSAGS